MVNEITVGTVSHGTLRTEDLLEAFASELERLCDNCQVIIEEANDLAGKLADGDADALDKSAALELVNDLIDELNNYAPPDMYFGAHEGDGADFGWWSLI